jgi:ParB-like chromosome segregation protein Spo0J
VETKNPQNILSVYNQGKMPLDKARVDKMADILSSGGKLPPVVVDNNLLLKDGHHRYQAHIQAGKTKIPIT